LEVFWAGIRPPLFHAAVSFILLGLVFALVSYLQIIAYRLGLRLSFR
jgi:hypothetical protein